MSGLDLTAWESDEEPDFTTEATLEEDETTPPSFEGINEDIVKAAIEKAKMNMNERTKFEYESWLARKYLVIFRQILPKISGCIF